MSRSLIPSGYLLSLRSNIEDLNMLIEEIRPVVAAKRRFNSWKFPDTDASHVDLADAFDVIDSESDAQLAQSCLLELLIDRLVYFLQLINCADGAGEAETSKTSLILISRELWSKSVSRQSVFKQLVSESRSKSRQIIDLEGQVSRVQSAASLPLRQFVGSASVASAGLRRAMAVARDESHKSSQTVETAFRPCESCHRLQRCLRQSARPIVSLCSQLEANSSLERFVDSVEGLEWLSESEVSRWTEEQNRDLLRLGKLVASTKRDNVELTTSLEQSSEICQKLQRDVAAAQLEIDKERQMLSSQEKQWVNTVQEKEKVIAEQKREIKKCEEKLKSLGKELQELVAKDCARMEKIQKKECELATIHQLLQHKNLALESLEEELESLRREDKLLHEMERNKNKQEMKTKTVNQRLQAFQKKHGEVLEQLEETMDQNERLKDQLDEAAENAKHSEATIRQLRKNLNAEIEQVEIKVNEKAAKMNEVSWQLNEANGKLEKLQSEQELLLRYPDLNGPVLTPNNESHSVLADMRNQIEANNLRVEILTRQTEKLQQNVTRMKSISQTTQAKPERDDRVPVASPPAPPPADDKRISAAKPPADDKRISAAKPPADDQRISAAKPPADDQRISATKSPESTTSYRRPPSSGAFRLTNSSTSLLAHKHLKKSTNNNRFYGRKS